MIHVLEANIKALHMDELVQERCKSIFNALEVHLSCPRHTVTARGKFHNVTKQMFHLSLMALVSISSRFNSIWLYFQIVTCVCGHSWRSKATYIRQSWQPQQRGHLHQEYLPNVIAQFLLPTWCPIAQARRKDSKVCKIVIEHIVENNIVATILRNDVHNVFINTYSVMPL